jgi:hypothetical protein
LLYESQISAGHLDFRTWHIYLLEYIYNTIVSKGMCEERRATTRGEQGVDIEGGATAIDALIDV